MITKKKALNGIIPVTTTKAVYMDGTNKTLQEAIDNGELGGITRQELDEFTGGKKQRYLTQSEYDTLSDAEKNNPLFVWNITDTIRSMPTFSVGEVISLPADAEPTVTIENVGDSIVFNFGIPVSTIATRKKRSKSK